MLPKPYFTTRAVDWQGKTNNTLWLNEIERKKEREGDGVRG